MNILYIATDSYLPLLGTSILSLLENNDSADIYILSPDLSEKSQNILRDTASPYNARIYCINIAGFEQFFPSAMNTSGFHPIVLARLVADKYLPKSLDTVLYLDCDVIIDGSLKPLLNVPLNKYAFAAVPELCMPDTQKAYIGLHDKDIYYNAGVVLLNLDYWRHSQMADKCVRYANEMQGRLLYNDQDVLNHCCRGHILRLSHRYNLSPVLHYFPRWFIRSYQPLYYCKSAREYRHILRHPAIIHYLGDERPWMKGNHNPYRDRYLHYRAMSPWKDTPLKSGRETYLFCYHMLNLITAVCPWFRKYFTKFIGIRYYRLFGKK